MRVASERQLLVAPQSASSGKPCVGNPLSGILAFTNIRGPCGIAFDPGKDSFTCWLTTVLSILLRYSFFMWVSVGSKSLIACRINDVESSTPFESISGNPLSRLSNKSI